MLSKCGILIYRLRNSLWTTMCLALLAVLVSFSRASSAGSLMVDTLSVHAGDTAAVKLQLVNDEAVSALQFTLVPTPSGGLEYLGTDKDGPINTASWVVAPRWRNDSLITLIYSSGVLIAPGDTSIASVKFLVSDDSYTRTISMKLSGVVLGGSDLQEITDVTVVDGSLKVFGQVPLPGDANADGKSDIFDVLDLLGVLSGKKESQFADINSDGKVDIFDLLALLNLLKGETSTG